MSDGDDDTEHDEIADEIDGRQSLQIGNSLGEIFEKEGRQKKNQRHRDETGGINFVAPAESGYAFADQPEGMLASFGGRFFHPRRATGTWAIWWAAGAGGGFAGGRFHEVRDTDFPRF